MNFIKFLLVSGLLALAMASAAGAQVAKGDLRTIKTMKLKQCKEKKGSEFNACIKEAIQEFRKLRQELRDAKGKKPESPAPVAETPAETPAAEVPAAETPAETPPAEVPAAETPAETPPAEVPAAETPAETPPSGENTAA